jgi:ectoine hydroxylase-related dioxygenase (phytanoyl-CoA dioxygenase family)
MYNSFTTNLKQKGYCVVPDVLDTSLLDALRQRFSDQNLGQTNSENFGNSGAFVVADYHDPIMVELLTWPKTLKALKGMGFPEPKLHNFYVSTKPPQAEALPWHSDLFYEYEKEAPSELFLIYYLGDTTPENGCLRVVPDSHKWSHEKRHAQPENADMRSDEVSLPVKAGDLFIGDRRIMHATHANNSEEWRTCLTIAYAPLFDQLDEPVKALIVGNRCLPPKGWWQQVNGIDLRLTEILPVYDGNAKPAAITD